MNEPGKRTLEKIRKLAKFLSEKHHITLARAISMNPSKMAKILSGEEKVSRGTIVKIAAYFFIPAEILTDDDKELPELDTLQIDEDLLSIQRHDIENDIERMKQKHFFSRNWKMIGYRKRLKLVLSVLLITVPLVIYILFCGSKVAFERYDDMRKYTIGSDGLVYDKYDPLQAEYHEMLEGTSKANNPDAYYVDVKVGVVLEKIKNIASATSSYEARMQLYFKFDKDEFLNMFHHYARNVLADQIINDYYAENTDDIRPIGSFSYSEWLDSHSDYFEAWCEIHDSEYYPGETPSNVLTDKNTMFEIGNGQFVADTLGSIK